MFLCVLLLSHYFIPYFFHYITPYTILMIHYVILHHFYFDIALFNVTLFDVHCVKVTLCYFALFYVVRFDTALCR